MGHFRDLLISWGPLGILVLSTIESAGIPNPGGTDWLLLVLTIARPADAALCAAMAVAGSLGGSIIFYAIMRKGGERYLARYTSSGRGLRFRAWFLRYGLVTVFIPALLPIPILPFKVFAACAGAMRVGQARFLMVLAAARIPRYAGLAYLGAELGENSTPWLKSHLWHMLAFAGLLFILLYALVRLAGRARVDPTGGISPAPAPGVE
jgi:membrane protein DedA with SNARE-associated domain